ncbi:MAG: Amidase from nicotinamidase family [Bacillota bacterium]|jgi:nicotinamidase-related amidase|nr:Amidase from nicotinamidase family [Bacillota bacterium]
MDEIKKIESDMKSNSIELNSMKKDKTVLVVIDMVNGFTYNGALSSTRVAKMAKNIVELNEKTEGYKKIFFLDSHVENSQEFVSFPKHCIKDTDESLLIPELIKYTKENNSVCIEKNSTNGFLAKGFQNWLENNIENIDNYIITGCVTDICVLQFALCLKAYFNEHNKNKRLIVPINTVDTYDGGSHDAYLMNLFALYNMKTSGIEVVEKIN